MLPNNITTTNNYTDILPLNENFLFFDRMTFDKVQEILKNQPIGSWLIRKSNSDECWTISFLQIKENQISLLNKKLFEIREIHLTLGELNLQPKNFIVNGDDFLCFLTISQLAMNSDANGFIPLAYKILSYATKIFELMSPLGFKSDLRNQIHKLLHNLKSKTESLSLESESRNAELGMIFQEFSLLSKKFDTQNPSYEDWTEMEMKNRLDLVLKNKK